MTVGSWEPGSDQQTLSLEALRRALLYVDPDAFPAQPPEDLLTLQPFAKSSKAQWAPVTDHFSADELKSLCRFFTLAETHWADWFGGDKNPVIWLCKALKKRGEFPDKELTQWIKQHSENRFLPYGNVLG